MTSRPKDLVTTVHTPMHNKGEGVVINVVDVIYEKSLSNKQKHEKPSNHNLKEFLKMVLISLNKKRKLVKSDDKNASQI